MSTPTSFDDDALLALAELAATRLSADERRDLAGDLTRILAYVKLLDELALDDVEPTTHPTDEELTLRADDTDEDPDVDVVSADALSTIAPEARAGFVLVPQVLDDLDSTST